MFVRGAWALGLLTLVACTDVGNEEDYWADAGPDFSGKGLSTYLHSAEDGRILARLRARRFKGFQKEEKRFLEWVEIVFVNIDLTVTARRAVHLDRHAVELRGKVKGILADGRNFTTPSLTYSGITRELKMEGPVVFSGEGHSLTAEHGATMDDRFMGMRLRGPVDGQARLDAP